MMNKIIILIEELFEDSEAIYPYYRMQEEGFDVKLVAPEAKKDYKGKYGVVMTSDLTPKDVNLNEVAGIIIVGGYAPDKLRRYKEIVDLVRAGAKSCKVEAAICHGGWVLVEADVLKGKKVTGVKAISKDLENAGAEYIDKGVVVDGNLVTARGPIDLPVFCKNIIGLIKAYTEK